MTDKRPRANTGKRQSHVVAASTKVQPIENAPHMRDTLIPGYMPLPPIGSGHTPSRAWYYRAHARQMAEGGPPLLMRIGGMSFIKVAVLEAYCEQQARPVTAADAPPRGDRRKRTGASASQPTPPAPSRPARSRRAASA